MANLLDTLDRALGSKDPKKPTPRWQLWAVIVIFGAGAIGLLEMALSQRPVFDVATKAREAREPSVQARASPSYVQARAFTDQISRVVTATNGWGRTTLPERRAALLAIGKLVEDTEMIFKAAPPEVVQSCRAAAVAAQNYVLDLNNAMLIASGMAQATEQALLGSMFMAVQLGDQYRQCRELIEGLQAR